MSDKDTSNLINILEGFVSHIHNEGIVKRYSSGEVGNNGI